MTTIAEAVEKVNDIFAWLDDNIGQLYLIDTDTFNQRCWLAYHDAFCASIGAGVLGYTVATPTGKSNGVQDLREAMLMLRMPLTRHIVELFRELEAKSNEAECFNY